MFCAKFGLILAELFWRKSILNFVNVFQLFCNNVILEKGMALHLNKLEFSLPPGFFVSSLVKFGPVVLEKKIFKYNIVFSLLSLLGKACGLSFEQS